MHAQQHAFLGARAAVVELLRLLYQVLGQVFAQLVACPQLIHGQQQALTRVDSTSGDWYATSGHMLWIGDRTRQVDGAHVEFFRGVKNPLAFKCGPSLSTDDLLRLYEVDVEQFALIQMNIGREVCRRLRATDELLFRVQMGEVPVGPDAFFRAV